MFDVFHFRHSDLLHAARIRSFRFSARIARIVSGVYVFELDRPLPIQDDRRCPGRRVCEVIHVCRHERKAAGGKGLIRDSPPDQLVAHSEGERTGNHHNVFVGRMRMSRDSVIGGKLQSNRIGNWLCGITR